MNDTENPDRLPTLPCVRAAWEYMFEGPQVFEANLEELEAFSADKRGSSTIVGLHVKAVIDEMRTEAYSTQDCELWTAADVRNMLYRYANRLEGKQ